MSAFHLLIGQIRRTAPVRNAIMPRGHPPESGIAVVGEEVECPDGSWCKVGARHQHTPVVSTLVVDSIFADRAVL